MNWRQRLGAFIGGFDAGQHHRRLRGFQATRAHVNALISASGPDITARARWLARNNGYALNAIESWAANTVGDGIKPISKLVNATQKEELQRLWLAWTDEADAEGLTDFYGLQRRAARRSACCVLTVASRALGAFSASTRRTSLRRTACHLAKSTSMELDPACRCARSSRPADDWALAVPLLSWIR